MLNNNTQPQQQQLSKRKHAWKHSTWITAAWEWFLELVGRAAEAILVVSVLYASVKLLPVVHMPASLDVVVFIAQFVALDVGGLSLGKLAKQAAEAGNAEGALYAGRMSKALIVVMIAGVVVVAIEQLFPIPGDWKLGIDTVLLIARSILAVLYGHVIHSVKVVDDQAQQPVPPALDIQAKIAEAVADLQTTFNQRLAEISNQVKQISSAPAVDQTAIVQAVTEHFAEQFNQGMRRLTEQYVQMNAVQRTRVFPEAPNALPNAEHKLPNTAKILPLNASGRMGESLQSVIYRLLSEDETRGPRELARLANCSPATAKNYRDSYFSGRNERNGTEQ